MQEGEEETQLKVFYSTENTREYREAEEQWLEVGINKSRRPFLAGSVFHEHSSPESATAYSYERSFVTGK
jgi:hypothetical protein